MIHAPALPHPAEHGLVLDAGDADFARQNDLMGIHTWLVGYGGRSLHTIRAFEREAIRFLMWLEVSRAERRLTPQVLPRGLSHRTLLGTVTTEETAAYVRFLRAPRTLPATVLARYDRTVQPFKKPLADTSLKQAIDILHGLFEALQNHRMPDGLPLVQMNPWRLARNSAPKTPSDPVEKALTANEWIEVKATIESHAADQPRHYHRLRWTFAILYMLLLRRHEVAALRMEDFQETPDGWIVKLVGKGGKAARLIAPTALIEELKVYRTHLGLTPLPQYGEKGPAIRSLNERESGDMAITSDAIYLMCKTVFHQTAMRIRETQPYAADRLMQASPHWGRHTGISHALEAGVDPRYVQAQARHASLNTTAKYDHKDRRNWRGEFEGKWLDGQR